MRQIVQNYKTGQLTVEEVPVPTVNSGGVLVKNAFSLISAGTERSSVEFARKSLLGKVKSRPEDLRKVIQLAKKQGVWNAYKTAMGRLETPTPLGYSSSGIVMEVGADVKEFKPGDRVACAGGGYASHAEVVFVPKNLCARVPDEVPLDWAAFTTLGAIALQGIRQADIRVGENCAVIGLGLLGQLTVQLLKASGCRVVGVDIDKEKIERAKKCGADDAVLRSDDVQNCIDEFTGGNGVDVVIVTAATASNDPFILAPQIARDRAKVVLVGVAKIDFPREPYYRKELSFVLARSYGPGRYDTQYEEGGIDYPIGYIRWTEQRNMEAVLDLMAEKKLDMTPLISHRFKIEDAQKAYDMVLGKTEEKFLGILFEYDTAKEHTTKVIVSERKAAISHPLSVISIGFIGVGNFARSFLLPHIKDINLVGVADVQGTTAQMVAKKYGYSYCTSDYKELLADKRINTICIATRHNLHAQIIIESLKAGKNVYCEKPLCLNKEELTQIIKTRNTFYAQHSVPIVMIGFNRRFAPLTLRARQFLAKKAGPYLVNYRINAGVLPQDHWLLDLKQGGGRIIGEVCHFVDYISCLTQARLISVYAESLNGSQTASQDNIIATLKYDDGSVGSISYFAIGDMNFPKERIEIFGDKKVCVIDDFKELILSNRGKQKRIKASQDKGYHNEIEALFSAIKEGKQAPISFSSIIETTLATFAINESTQKSTTVALPRIEIK